MWAGIDQYQERGVAQPASWMLRHDHRDCAMSEAELPATSRPPADAAVTSGRASGKQPLQDLMAVVDGFDLDRALRNLGGQMSLVRRVLGRFVDTYEPGFGPLLDEQRAHLLRGACATVGALRLHDLLAAYERELQAGASEAELRRQTQGIAAELAALVAQLREALAG
jgi:HPt (histidine-containing phosphotransfer) domain-containing protein